MACYLVYELFSSSDDSYPAVGVLSDDIPTAQEPIVSIPPEVKPITIPFNEPDASGNCHVYVIWGPNIDHKNGQMDIAKYGITCRADCDNRPASQVRFFNRKYNVSTFGYAFLFRNKTKQVALILETALTAEYIFDNNGELPFEHRLPCFKRISELDDLFQKEVQKNERINRAKKFINEMKDLYGY